MDQDITSEEAEYFGLAETWDQELYAKLKRDRLIALVVAGISAFLAAVAIFAVTRLTPLKTVEPYMIVVDKTTGFAESVRKMDYNRSGSVTANKVIVEAEIYNYVVARHTFDPTDYQRRYNELRYSTQAALLRDIRQKFARDNRTLSSGYRRTVNVKTISTDLANKTARIRFSTTLTAPGGEEQAVEHWYVEMAYDFVSLDIPNIERYRNPLGFFVRSYRIERETL